VRLGWTIFAGTAALAIAALPGCAQNMELKKQRDQTSSHVSPPPVAVPRLPPGTFDQAAERNALAAAKAARLGGDAATARGDAELAIARWPGDASAWTELAADCQAAADAGCAQFADFFAAKVEFTATLPPRAAVLGFATLASGKVGTHSGDYVYDQRTLETALRLASFYDEQDTLRGVRAPHLKPATQLSPSTSRIE